MEFRVLGPLQVLADDELLTLPRQQQILMATLLCSKNAVTSIDRLVEALWGERPPATSVKSIRVKIHSLRRALGDFGRIDHHHAGGYLLTVQEDELDEDRFAGLVARGRDARCEGRLEHGAELLRLALSLWRGPAFAGLEGVAGVAEKATRLMEERQIATEDLFAAELDMGHEADIVGELIHLVTQHPFRERVRGQLMTALYRLGRQADALQVYREGKRLLADELGIDPSRTLRELEAAILTEDPRLDRPAIPVRLSSSPAELPPDIDGFVGRAKQAAHLVKVLSGAMGPTKTATVHGPAGIGKSALAAHVAHRVRKSYPDGQLYVDLHGATPHKGPLAPLQVLHRWLRTLDPGCRPSDDIDEAAGQFRSLVAAHRMLIVLDNAADAAQIRPLMAGGDDCAVLITSRRPLSTVNSKTHVALDTIPQDEALELFGRLVDPCRVAAEPQVAWRIVRLCDRLPFALRLAAARICAHPQQRLAAFADRLADAGRRLDELQFADLSVRTSLIPSLDALSEQAGGTEAIRCFRILGLIDGTDFSVSAAAALADRTIEQTRHALDQLVEFQLLQPLSAGHYHMQDLVRLYAREQMTTPRDRLVEVQTSIG